MPPPASSPVQIRSHPTKGRALYATQPFQPGQVILPFTPLFLIPSVARLASLCTFCLRPGSPRACSRCHAAYYCDSACQAAAWSAVHARECKALRQHVKDESRRRALPMPVRALVQALLCRGIEDGLARLEGHVLERRAAGGEEWRHLEMMALAACAYSGKGTAEEQVRSAVELLCKIQTNSFQRFDPDLGPVGIFLEPTLSMVNHSCVPNAMVQFTGRKAILLAENPIQAGDEIEISYTFYTNPLSKRKEALSHYRFECRCLRCKDNLNVYQVCAMSPSVGLNSLSLVTDLSRLRQHPAASSPRKKAAANHHGKEADHLEYSLATAQSLPEQRRLLQKEYVGCAGLIEEELWAISPLPELLFGIATYYGKEGNFLFALATACFVATACEPYQYTTPFYPTRLGTLFLIAKLLTHTAAATASLTDSVKTVAAKATLDQKLQETLQEIDQVSLCQMLLFMILRWTPDDDRAREVLNEIEGLPGREKESSLIDEWRRQPNGDQSRDFFKYAVVQQVNALASLGRAVLKLDFEAGPGKST